MVKLGAIACTVMLVHWPVTAFTTIDFPTITNNFDCKPRQEFFVIEATPEQFSEQFRAYMTKSHEDKLKAVRTAEEKKNVEIRALKKQLEEMKTGIVSENQSVEEISTKLEAYQKFISQYIVNAQQEKARAVKSAEEAISKKYEDKLNALMLNPADASSIIKSGKDDPVSNEFYDKRSATVAAAAAAGKSRWGAGEVQRVTSSADKSSTTITTEKADPASNETYEKRSATVAAAAAAGKSRWGAREVERVMSSKN